MYSNIQQEFPCRRSSKGAVSNRATSAAPAAFREKQSSLINLQYLIINYLLTLLCSANLQNIFVWDWFYCYAGGSSIKWWVDHICHFLTARILYHGVDSYAMLEMERSRRSRIKNGHTLATGQACGDSNKSRCNKIISQRRCICELVCNSVFPPKCGLNLEKPEAHLIWVRIMQKYWVWYSWLHLASWVQ